MLAMWSYSKAGFRMAMVTCAVAQAHNPGTGEAEAGDQPRLSVRQASQPASKQTNKQTQK